MPEEAGSSERPKTFVVRTATMGDVDDMTRIHRDGFTEEPQVLYCYPLRDQYPEDYWHWTRKEYTSYLEQPQKFVVQVIEAVSTRDGKVVAETAGLAVWNIAVLAKAEGPGNPNSSLSRMYSPK